MIKPRLSSAIVLLALLSTSCTKSKTKRVKLKESNPPREQHTVVRSSKSAAENKPRRLEALSISQSSCR